MACSSQNDASCCCKDCAGRQKTLPAEAQSGVPSEAPKSKLLQLPRELKRGARKDYWDQPYFGHQKAYHLGRSPASVSSTVGHAIPRAHPSVGTSFRVPSEQIYAPLEVVEPEVAVTEGLPAATLEALPVPGIHVPVGRTRALKLPLRIVPTPVPIKLDLSLRPLAAGLVEALRKSEGNASRFVRLVPQFIHPNASLKVQLKQLLAQNADRLPALPFVQELIRRMDAGRAPTSLEGVVDTVWAAHVFPTNGTCAYYGGTCRDTGCDALCSSEPPWGPGGAFGGDCFPNPLGAILNGSMNCICFCWPGWFELLLVALLIAIVLATPLPDDILAFLALIARYALGGLRLAAQLAAALGISLAALGIAEAGTPSPPPEPEPVPEQFECCCFWCLQNADASVQYAEEQYTGPLSCESVCGGPARGKYAGTDYYQAWYPGRCDGRTSSRCQSAFPNATRVYRSARQYR